MNPNYKKFFKYLYALGVLSFLGFTYGSSSLSVLTIAGGVSALLFIFVFNLVFRAKSEKKLFNLLRYIGIFVATLIIFWFYFVIFLASNLCLGMGHYELFQNIFTKNVEVLNIGCGGGPAPWYYGELPWNDVRNPHPEWRHVVPLSL